MKKTILALAALAFLSMPVAAYAAPAAKSYQVTGPVLDVTERTITVQKGDEKWQINMGPGAKASDYKVGSTVTIQYTMQATRIDVKGAAAAAPVAAVPAATPAVTAKTTTTATTTKAAK